MRVLKSYLVTGRELRRVAVAGMLLLALTGRAFPPAPSHLIYGQVRDERGLPLFVTNALIVLEATNDVQVTSTIVPDLEPGVNYRLNVSIDSGVAPDLYKITALQPNVPFRI